MCVARPVPSGVETARGGVPAERGRVAHWPKWPYDAYFPASLVLGAHVNSDQWPPRCCSDHEDGAGGVASRSK